MRIFLSHSHQDNDWCSAFVEELKRYDADIWYDKHLYGGDRWRQTIETELKGRDTFLVVLTPDSWGSDWVQDEITLAMSYRKRIIPVMYKPIETSGFISNRQTCYVIGLSIAEAAKTVAKAIFTQEEDGRKPPPPPPPPIIQCSQGHINPAGSTFCDECGEPLAAPMRAVVNCPNCGWANPADEPFCSNCGANPDGSPAAINPVPVAAYGSAFASAPLTGLRAMLVVGSDNTTYDLTGKAESLIGYEDVVSNIFPDVDLSAHGGDESGVGRRHAVIRYANGQYLIEDLNSINYTFVNRQRIAPKTPTPLKDGDEIRLGRFVLRFRIIP